MLDILIEARQFLQYIVRIHVIAEWNIMDANLTRLDLGLLVLFEALAAERNVTRAASKVGMTQPSASKGLDRLRHLFEDELYVRTSRGIRPTPRALELEAPVRQALLAVRNAVAKPTPFDPRKASGVMRVAMSDAAEFVLLPTLIRRLAKEAPGIDLRARPLDKETAFEALDAGKLDCLVGVFGKLPKRYDRRTLWSERFSCVLRANNSEKPERLTLRSYAHKTHVLVSLRDDARGYVDEVLARHGLTRRIVATLGRFMIVPYVIEATDCIATLPSRMAHRVVQGTQCVVVEPPFKMQPWEETLIWHRGTERTPLQAWFRRLITECARDDTAVQGR